MTEKFEQKDNGLEEFEKEHWNYMLEEDEGALNGQEIKDLLLRDDFAKHIAESLVKSRYEKISPQETFRLIEQRHFPGENETFKLQEFGFFAYQHETYSRKDRKIYLSGLIEGQEYKIAMPTYNFPKSQFDPEPDEHIDPLLAFHCHPGIQSLASLFYRFDNRRKSLFNTELSRKDLSHLRYLADRFPPVIYALGNLYEMDVKKTGRILLVSFKSYDAYKNLDPDSLYKTATKTVEKTGNVTTAYEMVGLNAAVVKVNLQGKPSLNPGDVRKASAILAQRQSI